MSATVHHGLLSAKRDARARSGAPLDPREADGWGNAWLAAKAARGQTSVGDRRAHYVHHIKPVVAGKQVRDWTAVDLRAVVASLDTKIAAVTLAPKTARNVWGTATKMAGDAMRSKVEALRCRTDNPAKDVEGPDRGDERAKPFLHPSELIRVLECEEIPLRWRRAIALAVYLFPRAGELRALRWESVDLQHGTIHIHEAFERRSRQVKATKTGKGRRFSLELAIVPLLEAMHAESGGEGLVCPLPNRMADRLRGWLERAGVTRRELIDAESPTTKALGWHDLRATGLTWMPVREDDPLKIMQRAGHEDFATSQSTSARRRRFGTASATCFRRCRRRSSEGILAQRLAQPRPIYVEPLSGTRDSNPRHPAWEAGTLPTELVPQSEAVSYRSARHMSMASHRHHKKRPGFAIVMAGPGPSRFDLSIDLRAAPRGSFLGSRGVGAAACGGARRGRADGSRVAGPRRPCAEVSALRYACSPG